MANKIVDVFLGDRLVESYTHRVTRVQNASERDEDYIDRAKNACALTDTLRDKSPTPSSSSGVSQIVVVSIPSWHWFRPPPLPNC
jgi:hypothetical protein